MADILLDNESIPSTPASGKTIIAVDSTTKALYTLNDAARAAGGLSRNDATASQGAGFASDTYITNSGIQIPSFGMRAGQLAVWYIGVTKTAAGTAATVLTVRLGAGQSTSDTSRVAMTQQVAQTATAADALWIVVCSVRSVSASGVVAATFTTGATAFGSGGNAASSTFDNTAVAGQFLGLSLNGGASASYTLQVASAVLIG